MEKADIKALGALIQQPQAAEAESLPPLGARGGFPAASGRATPEPGKGGGGGGIDGPLDEGAAQRREYHPEKNILSSDGVFAIKLKPLKSITMKDKKGREVVLRFAPPPVTP